jgi:heme exporter protein B
MTAVLRQIGLLCAKDLKVQARSRQTVGLVLMLGILIVVVLGLGLGPRQLAAGPVATAALWVAYLFGGVLSFEGTMAVERHDGALAGLLLAPVPRGAIYVAKLIANLALMGALALVVTPVAILLFSFDLSAAPLGFVAVMAASFVGFAAVGTLFSAVVSSTRLQGGLLAMVVFPLALPLVISSSRLTAQLYESPAPVDGKAFAILVAFDVIFLVMSWLAFEWLIEP